MGKQVALENSFQINSTLLLVCEAIEDALPHQHKPEHYINPVLREMTALWVEAKKKIANAIVAAAEKVTLVESTLLEATSAIGFSTFGKNQMYGEVRSTMKEYGYATATVSKKALKKARNDRIPKLTKIGAGQGGFTTVMLSKQGLEEVVAGLQWQKGFVDDLSKSVVKRVENITKGRYASTYDLRQQINRTFRIDRDAALAKFHGDVSASVDRLMKGNITPLGFQRQMADSIETNYRKLYKEGKGGTKLQKWEEEFVRRQAKTQDQYLNNFRQYLDQKKTMGEDYTGRVSQRAHLYAERGSAMFEAGHVASLPDDVILDWELQPAEHCPTCPVYAAGGPYTKDALPGFPGEGFHLTVCGTNCKCNLQVSDLYVTTTPEPEQDLAVKLIKPPPPKPPPIIKPPPPKPPPGVGTAKRTGESTVVHGGKTYTKELYKRPGAKQATTRYRVVGGPDDEVLFMSKQILPKEVQVAFNGKFVPPGLPPGIERPAKNLIRYKDHTYEQTGPNAFKKTRHSDLKVSNVDILDLPWEVRQTFNTPFVKPPIIKPPPVPVAVRTAKDVVAYDKKLYTKTFDGQTFVFKEYDTVTGTQKFLPYKEMPDTVRAEFRKKWKSPTGKKVIGKKPPAKPVAKPKPVPKHKPTPNITSKVGGQPTNPKFGVIEYQGKYYQKKAGNNFAVADSLDDLDTFAWEFIGRDKAPPIVRAFFQTGNLEDAIKAMEVSAKAALKYKAPEEVRKEIERLVSGKNKLKADLNVQLKAIREESSLVAKKFDTYVQMSADPDYSRLVKQAEALDRETKVITRSIRDEVNSLVRANQKGFTIESEFTGYQHAGFEKKVKKQLKDFSKLLDEEFFVSRKRYQFGVTVENRGKNVRASALRNKIHLDQSAPSSTTIHEMGHFLEHSDDRVQGAASKFLRERTEGESSITLNKAMKTTAYDADEVTKKDKFIHAYMGKYYDGATEIMSMGIELMNSNPVKLATKDPGMFDFIYNTCRGIF